MKYEDFNRKLGIKSTGDITRPRIILKNEFVFPEDSIWYWGSRSPLPTTPKDDAGFMTNVKQAKIYISSSYKLPDGNFTTKHKVSDAIRDIKMLTKYPITDDVKRFMIVPKDVLLIFNYGSLNFLHSYKGYSGHTVDKFNNRLRTMVNDMRFSITNKKRRRFITVNIPNLSMNSLKSLEKSLTLSKVGISKLTDDDDILSLIEIWKYMHPRYRDDSIYNMLTEEELSHLDFIFTYNLGTTVFNAKILFGMVGQYNMESIVKLSHVKARRVLFLFLLKIHNLAPKPLTEITTDKIDITSKATEKGVEGDFDDVVGDIDKHIEAETREVIFKDEDFEDEEVNIESTPLTMETLKDFKITKEELIENAIRDGFISKKESEKIKDLLTQQRLDGTITSYTVSENDLKLDVDKAKLPDLPTILDKSMLEDRTNTSEREYIKNVYQKDIKSVIYKMQDAGIMVTNHEVKVIKDITGAWEDHYITTKPIGGNVSTNVIRLPVINEDGVIKTNANKYQMIKQRVDYVIRKIDSNAVAITSAVGKIFVTKARFSKDNLGNYINKVVNKALEDETHPISTVVNIPVIMVDKVVHVEYSYFARTIKTLVFKNNSFSFDFENRRTILKKGDSLGKIEGKKFTLMGDSPKGYILMSLEDGLIHFSKDDKKRYHLTEYLELDMSKAPKEFATVKVNKSEISIGLILSHYLGIKNLLNILKCDYELSDKNRVESSIDDIVVKFSDSILHIKNPSDLTSMVMAGLSVEKSLKTINFDLLNKKNNTAFILMGYDMRVINTIDFNLLMFLDPISITTLKQNNDPDNLPSLFIKASEMLLTDYQPHGNDLTQMTIRGYDRVASMMYKVIATGVKEQMSSKNMASKNKLTIKRFDTWGLLSGDPTLAILEDLNPIASLKQRHDITYTGFGGRAMATMTPKTREYHVTDVGVISEANKDSGKVGISMYSSANPLFKDLRGLVGLNENPNSTNMLSVSASLAAFALNDDPKRLNFIDIQNQHTVAMDEYMILPIRTGYENILPMRMREDFAVVAKEECVIISKDDKHITVKYKESGEKRYVLKEWYTKEESGKAYKHNLISYLKKGDKVKVGEAILFDDTFFALDMLNPKSIALKNGLLLRTAFVENFATYEDSYEGTAFLKGMLTTTNIAIKTKTIDFDDNILTYAKIGDELDFDDIYLQYGKGEIDEKIADDVRESLSDFSGNTHESGYKGVVKDFRIYYNCEKSEMTKSLKKLVTESDKRIFEKEGEDLTGRVDSSFSDGGIPLVEGKIIIKYYIELKIPNSLGNKIIFGHQLKATNGEISNTEVFFGNYPVHCYFSTTSTEARIVGSPDKLGVLNTGLHEISQNVRMMMKDFI